MTTLVWNNASEWDAAQSEDGVAHESVSGTDHGNADNVLKGYTYATFNVEPANLLGYWPLHEDSGSANDISGNGHTGTVTGATQGATGILNSTAYQFDGADDKVDVGDVIGAGAFTAAVWVYLDSTGTDHPFISQFDNTDGGFIWRYQNGNVKFFTNDGSYGGGSSSSGTLPTGEWVHVAVVYDGGSNADHYFNGSYDSSTTDANTMADPTVPMEIGAEDFISEYTEGRICEAAIWDTQLSGSQIQTLYDVVDTPGTLTTAKKTS